MNHTSRTTTAVHQHTFADEVRRDLSRPQKQLPSKYLYDALGSQLFEAISRLPWYRSTEAERSLLRTYAAEVIDALPQPATITELGPGSGEKLVILAEALQQAERAARVHLIDVSGAALERSEQSLGRIEDVSVVGHESTYEVGLGRASAARASDEAMLVLFLGSSIGNFDRTAACDFMKMVRRMLRPDDLLLLGTDLVKPAQVLRDAYDDPLGVTAAFNLNLLARINRELGGEFVLSQFTHEVRWNEPELRIEIHLRSTCDQTVRIAAADCEVRFAAGETIWTENSHKYRPDGVVAMGQVAGFASRQQWIESDALFALTLFETA